MKQWTIYLRAVRTERNANTMALKLIFKDVSSLGGSTISAGLGGGNRCNLAARFSFLLGTPAFFGAGLLQVAKTLSEDSVTLTGNVVPIAAGFVAAAVVGVLAIRFLLRYLRNRTLYIFSIYCLVVGLLTITLSFVR